jgi:membrane protein
MSRYGTGDRQKLTSPQDIFQQDGKSLLVGIAGFVAAVLLIEFAASRAIDFAEIPKAVDSESDHGRSATIPSEIPPRGWKDIVWRIYENIGKHRVVALGAGVTFYGLLAIFPALAALVAIYGLFADGAEIGKQLDQLSSFVPSGALDVARDQLTRVASSGSQTLSLTFFFGLATSLWSANAGIKSLFDTMNIVYGEEEKRSFFRLNAISLTFTAGALLFALAAIGAVLILPVALNYLELPDATDLLFRVARWPALLVVVTFGLACLYRFGPSRDAARWSWVMWGSIGAALLWLAASALFSWYAANFGSFNKTYGSLGGAVGLMTWIWISTIIVLLGAELNAEMEQQTARDTTGGPSKPLGARGAHMADTVGTARSS